MWLAKVSTGRLRELTNQIDLSYGIYIFGWPITQTLILTLPTIGTLALVTASLILAVSVALPSWFLIERPALRSRGLVVSLLRSCFSQIAKPRRASVSEPALR